MMNRFLLALLTIVLSSQAAFAQVEERVIYASVVDGKGNPVSGLTGKDFIVREDGQAREVLNVARDAEPLQIALLVDNSAEMLDSLADLRRAIASFVAALRPGVQLGLFSLAERPTIVVPYTTDKEALQKGIGKIITTQDSANYVLDGIAEVSQGLAKRPGSRSILAVVTARGPELSYRDYGTVLRIARDSGMPALHALIVRGSGRRSLQIVDHHMTSFVDAADRGTDRDIVLAQMTMDTGGRYEEVLSTSALPMKLEQLSNELSNQYRVTFASPQRLVPPKDTNISVRDPKLQARGTLAK